MKALIFQVPYPAKGESLQCIQWQKNALDSVEPGSADLLLLQENANCTGIATRDETISFIKGPGAEFVEFMDRTARRTGALLLAGVMTQDADGVLRNRLMMITPDGKRSFPYTKNHLVQPELDKGIVPGDRAEPFEYNGVRFAAGICFDFYFPELFTHYAKMRPDVLIFASHQRQEPGENIVFLSRARAFDCGCTLLRCAPAMFDPKVGGHSMAVAPDGRVIADAGGVPGILKCEFDPKARFMRAASFGEHA